MSAIFSLLHLALVSGQHSNVGVSFPEALNYGQSIGMVIRVHGDEATLNGLLETGFFSGISEFVGPVALTVQEVPEGAFALKVARVQCKSSPARMRRRAMRRHQLSEEEAAQRIPDSVAEFTDLPFVRVQSQSTGHAFRLFVAQTVVGERVELGQFNTYGFSSERTVPWF
jgi:CRISPR-associated endonuclease Csy4